MISNGEASRLLDGGGNLRVGHGESLVDGFEFVAGVLVDGCFVVHDLKCHLALKNPFLPTTFVIHTNQIDVLKRQ